MHRSCFHYSLLFIFDPHIFWQNFFKKGFGYISFAFEGSVQLIVFYPLKDIKIMEYLDFF